MRLTIRFDEETPLGIGEAIEYLERLIEALDIKIASVRVRVFKIIGFDAANRYYDCRNRAFNLCQILKARQKKYDLDDDTPIESIYLGLMTSVLDRARALKLITLTRP